jgi:hypothetical protein
MKIKRDVTEAAIYGLLGMIYTSLFFFGAFYPQYGLPRQSAICQSRNEQMADEEEEEVVCKSLLLERLKEWF